MTPITEVERIKLAELATQMQEIMYLHAGFDGNIAILDAIKDTLLDIPKYEEPDDNSDPETEAYIRADLAEEPPAP